MKPDEAIRIFDNYRDYVNDGSKVTIHYDQVKTMVEAYGVLEKVINSLTDTNKELLELNLDLNKLVVKHVLKNNKLKCCIKCYHYAGSLITCCRTNKHFRIDPGNVCEHWKEFCS